MCLVFDLDMAHIGRLVAVSFTGRVLYGTLAHHKRAPVQPTCSVILTRRRSVTHRQPQLNPHVYVVDSGAPWHSWRRHVWCSTRVQYHHAHWSAQRTHMRVIIYCLHHGNEATNDSAKMYMHMYMICVSVLDLWSSGGGALQCVRA
jgi:hypothetical protein